MLKMDHFNNGILKSQPKSNKPNGCCIYNLVLNYFDGLIPSCRFNIQEI